MNIKTLFVLILVGISYASFAQEDPDGGDRAEGTDSQQQGRNSNRNQINNTAQKEGQACQKELDEFKLPAGPNGEAVAVSPTVAKRIQQCSILQGLAASANANLRTSADTFSSIKNEVTCKRTSGYTLDYDYCSNSVKALNMVINAESVMALQQQVRTDLSNKNIQEKTVKQAAAGNLTTGVFDATIEANKFAKGLEQEKALAYSGAVAALGSTYAKWKKEEALIDEKCRTAQPLSNQVITQIGQGRVPPANCKEIANENLPDLVPNKNVKAVIAGKIAEYIAKGIAAGIKMNQYDTRAKTVEAVKDSLTPDEEDAMMERCVFNPTDPACSKSNTRTPGSTFTPGDFSLGGTGSNSFTLDPTTDNFGEEGSAPTVDETVAGTNSPFLDEAKEAKGILDPAAAAQATPTGGAGGGGGGVGGGGGGGSASLGSDLEGADKDGNKDPSLKTSKSSGNYAFGAGGGYSAVKGGKEDANPFASLFDSKSAGGIEEDRSIASGDIDGAASGLFQKISKRYNLIQSEKRIEANNLE